MRRLTQLLTVITAIALGASACSNANPAGPSAMGSGAVINGAIVSDGGVATKHSGVGGGSQTVPGLTVRVAGTTISAAVDSADQFTLPGVPSGSVQLVFNAPSLSATVDLADVQAGQTIEIGVMISGSTVVLDSQRRSQGNELQLEGRIEALPPTTRPGTFVVAGRHVTTNDATRYFFRGGESGTFADLEVGMRVHVKGQRSGDSLLASVVQMQNPHVDLPVQINGIVEDLSGTAAAFSFHIGDRLIKGDLNTAFQGGGRFADLANGKRVEVRGQQQNGFVYALRIHVNN